MFLLLFFADCNKFHTYQVIAEHLHWLMDIHHNKSKKIIDFVIFHNDTCIDLLTKCTYISFMTFIITAV